MSLISPFIILVFLFVLESAYGWESGKTQIFPLDCAGLEKQGADLLYLEVTAESGSYGVPYLVGKKDDFELWRKRAPADEVNLAKFGYSCTDSTITLSHADPGPSSYHQQTLLWDGEFVERRVEFKKGSDNWSVYKETSPGQSDRFRFWAKKGQMVKVEMKNTYGPSIFNLYKPGSEESLQTKQFGKEKVEWDYVIKKTGDHLIIIDGITKDSRYYLRLWIN